MAITKEDVIALKIALYINTYLHFMSDSAPIELK